MFGLLWRFAVFASLLLLCRDTLAAPRNRRVPRNIKRSEPSILRRDLAPCEAIFKSDEFLFFASDVYDCLTSVPFNDTVGSEFLQYYKDTLQFQSTLPYLKNPPASYLQPSVDLLGGLNLIQNEVEIGTFKNEYAFESALQALVYQAHDFHMFLDMGIFGIFGFASPLGIVSVSADGKELPKVYIIDDIAVAYDANVTWAPRVVVNPGPDQWTPSAVTKINGIDVVEYLSRYASLNAFGNRDPQADWNDLMTSAAQSIQGSDFTAFQGETPFYNGEEIEFAFENDTSTGPLPFVAIYMDDPSSKPDIASGKDMYTYYVLGEDVGADQAASTSATAIATTATPTVSVTSTAGSEATTTDVPDRSEPAQPSISPNAESWPVGAYPENPLISQPFLDEVGGGVITGYIVNDTKIGVLSIPSFRAFGDGVEEFSATVEQFLELAKKNGATKIVIDVQQNYGGQALLAVDTFRHFFPDHDPHGAFRYRAHKNANKLGTVFSDYFKTLSPSDSDYPFVAVSPWTGTDYLKASTSKNFTSWTEFFGPHPDHGDLFTTPARYNLSSVVFDEAAIGDIAVFGYGNRGEQDPPPFAAEDIVILTDSVCHSACALFVEQMHHEAGVKTVAVGGRPQDGPMQAIGGTRGALKYDSNSIDVDMEVAQKLGNVTFPDRDIDFWVQYAGVNLADQVRKGQSFPLQFAYEAADCRIFYTPSTFLDYAALWKYAADAAWSDPGLCVTGSTGANKTIETPILGLDTQPVNASGLAALPAALRPHNGSHALFGVSALEDGGGVASTVSLGQKCSVSAQNCAQRQTCGPSASCSDSRPITVTTCKQTCARNGDCRSRNGQTFVCKGAGAKSVDDGVCEPAAPVTCAKEKPKRADVPVKGFRKGKGTKLGKGKAATKGKATATENRRSELLGLGDMGGVINAMFY